jgi:hypothetical protein
MTTPHKLFRVLRQTAFYFEGRKVVGGAGAVPLPLDPGTVALLRRAHGDAAVVECDGDGVVAPPVAQDVQGRPADAVADAPGQPVEAPALAAAPAVEVAVEAPAPPVTAAPVAAAHTIVVQPGIPAGHGAVSRPGRRRRS